MKSSKETPCKLYSSEPLCENGRKSHLPWLLHRRFGQGSSGDRRKPGSIVGLAEQWSLDGGTVDEIPWAGEGRSATNEALWAGKTERAYWCSSLAADGLGDGCEVKLAEVVVLGSEARLGEVSDT